MPRKRSVYSCFAKASANRRTREWFDKILSSHSNNVRPSPPLVFKEWTLYYHWLQNQQVWVKRTGKVDKDMRLPTPTLKVRLTNHYFPLMSEKCDYWLLLSLWGHYQMSSSLVHLLFGINKNVTDSITLSDLGNGGCRGKRRLVWLLGTVNLCPSENMNLP